MRLLLKAPYLWFLALVPAAAVAVTDPQAARDATPEVVVCCLGNVVAREGEEVSSYTAQCVVRKVIRSSFPIHPGETLTLAYEVHHAVFDQPRSTDPGLEFPTPPPPIENGDRVTAYLHRARDPGGQVIYVPHIGMDSFEPVTVDGAPGASGCPPAE